MPNSSNFFNLNLPDLNPLADPNDLINLTPLPPSLVSLNNKRSLLDYNNNYDWSYLFNNLGNPTNIFGIDVYTVPGELLMSYVNLEDEQGRTPQHEGYFWLGNNNYAVPPDYTAHEYLFVRNPITGYFSPVAKGGELSNMIDAYNTKWGKLASDNFTGVLLYILDTRDEYLRRRQLAILQAKHDYLENMWNTYGLNWNMADMPGDDFFAYLTLGEGDYYELSKKYPNLLLFRRLDDDTDETNAPPLYQQLLLWDKDAVDLANNQRNIMTSFLLSDNYANLANNTNSYSVPGQQLMNNMFTDAAFHYGLVGAAIPAGTGATGAKGAGILGNMLTKVANSRLAVGTAVSGLPGVRHVANAGRWLRNGYLAYAPSRVVDASRIAGRAVQNAAGTVHDYISPGGAVKHLFGTGWTSDLVGAANALYGAGQAAYNIGKDIYNGQAPSVENIGSIASASGVPYINTPLQLYKFFGTNIPNFSENPDDLENLYEATKNVSSALKQ